MQSEKNINYLVIITTSYNSEKDKKRTKENKTVTVDDTHETRDRSGVNYCVSGGPGLDW